MPLPINNLKLKGKSHYHLISAADGLKIISFKTQTHEKLH
jgi:hypothetical protein